MNTTWLNYTTFMPSWRRHSNYTQLSLFSYIHHSPTSSARSVVTECPKIQGFTTTHRPSIKTRLSGTTHWIPTEEVSRRRREKIHLCWFWLYSFWSRSKDVCRVWNGGEDVKVHDHVTTTFIWLEYVEGDRTGSSGSWEISECPQESNTINCCAINQAIGISMAIRLVNRWLVNSCS